MQLTTDPSLALVSQRIDTDLQEFLARGGEIEAVPVGAMAETGWTAKQRCNPQIHTKSMRQAEEEERAARKLARQSTPTPRGTERRPAKVKAIKPPKPPAPPKPPRVRKPRPVYAKTGRTIGRPRNGEGTKARKVLDVLATGNKTNREIAELNGWDAKLTGVTIQKMCERGSVKRVAKISGPGVSHCVVWGLA